MVLISTAQTKDWLVFRIAQSQSTRRTKKRPAAWTSRRALFFFQGAVYAAQDLLFFAACMPLALASASLM